MASLKGILGGIGKAAGGLITGGLGGLAGDAVEILKGQFPGKMSEQEQKQFELAMQDAVHKRELETLKAWNEQEAEFNNRIAEMEGTAGDLLQAGWIGRVVLFLRGLQRPLWGFLVLFMDIMMFSGKWSILTDVTNPAIAQQLSSMLWVINLIVLTFLFGERTVKNLMPLIESLMAVKYQGQAGSSDRAVG
jgi:hypothetical protein